MPSVDSRQSSLLLWILHHAVDVYLKLLRSRKQQPRQTFAYILPQSEPQSLTEKKTTSYSSLAIIL